MQLITSAVGIGRRFAVVGQQVDVDGDPAELWTIGFWSEGDWRSEVDFEFPPAGLAADRNRPDAWTVLGTDGEILDIRSALDEPRTSRSDIVTDRRSGFTTIVPYRDGFAAAQLGRSVHVGRDGRWSPLGSLDAPADGRTAGLLALATLDDALYGVGWQGELWRHGDDGWRRLDSPVNIVLSGLAATADDLIACGRLGIVLRGRDDRWSCIEHERVNEDLWSVAVFRGEAYLSSMSAIYRLVGDALLPVDDGLVDGSYYALSANEEILISTGARGLTLFDGDDWLEILG